MPKILKYVLLAVAGIGLIAGALAAFVAATFNPNDYKPQIQQLVKEKLERTLKIGGDIKLSFYPTIGANLAGISLSEHASDKEFASVESVRVALQFMPLLSKQLVVSQVEVRGLRANLLKRKDGSSNIDDLIGKDKNKKPAPTPPSGGQEAQKPMQFNIDHVLIDNAGFSYADEATGARYSIGKMSLKTGRIAAGTPSDIELVVQGIAATQPKANLEARLKTRVTLDIGTQRFKLDGLDFSLKGEAAGMNPLALSVKGDVEGDAKSLKSAGLSLELDAKQGERTIKAKLATPLAANLEISKFDLPKLVASLALTDAKSPDKPVSLSLTGAAHADLAKQVASLEFTTKFDESSINGKAGVARFDPPSYVFDLNIDKLDVDRYAPPKPAANAEGAKGASGKPEQPLDFSAIKTLNARGSIKIGALKVSKLNLQNVRMDVKAGAGRLDVNPLAANLYEGTMTGALALVAAATPQVSLKQALSGISIGPLLKDAADKDMLEGKGNVTIDVTGQGATASAIKQALNGSASLDLANGALKGINIGAAVRTAKDALGAARGRPAQSQAANSAEKTDFTELKASFTIRNGIAHNSDLSMKSPLLRLGGEGDINIGTDSLNYVAKATLVATAAGQGGKDAADLKGLMVPVRISGPFSALKYEVDINAMANAAAKQKIDEKKEEVKTKVQDKIKDQLKGLFGR